jgi:hypothetical protein
MDQLTLSMGMRLFLWTAATSGSVVHPPGDMLSWISMMIWWCRLGKSPDSSTTAVWQSYQQNHIGASRRNGQNKWEFYFVSISFTLASGLFKFPKMLIHGISSFTSHLKEGVLRIFITLNPLRPGGNYMNHVLWQSLMLHFIFIGFASFSL